MHLGVALPIFLATLRTFYNKFRMQFVGTTTTSRQGFKFSPPGDLNATETETEPHRAGVSEPAGAYADRSPWMISML